MKTAEIRESYLSFFESKGCVRKPSSSLIPDDPSLLLTAAGMVQFKPIFMGAVKSPLKRVTTVQKCVRTTDIDIIGTTNRHLSFFEMLGNFSFGDYFKREAIDWAWEYSTKVLGLDPSRIYATVFETDDEAHALWEEVTDIDPSHISRLGEEHNFWAAGPTGPCGPCSELYYDLGPKHSCGSEECAPGCDCERFLEYWNLVFMEFDRDEEGTLTPLPKKNIDTGMGLERITSILQNVDSNYETDEFFNLIQLIEEISGKKYKQDEDTDIAFRIIADHARAVAFMISDGILPSNEGRGYVLRRLIRRAVLYGRMGGIEDAFLGRIVKRVIEIYGPLYPELVEQESLSLGVVDSEEERFSSTLRTGLNFLDAALADLKRGDTLSGEKAFTLHDTYGFPIDLSIEISAEKGIQVDREEFEVHMKAQKDRARENVRGQSWAGFGSVYADLLSQGITTEFNGYQYDESESKLVAIVGEGKSLDSIKAGDTEVELVLDETPFYAEGGGQVGDKGRITLVDAHGEECGVAIVKDTVYREKTLIVHQALIESGEFKVGDTVFARIDVTRRERIRRNHTCTHLLHWALKKILGDHASQAGSYVNPERFRFDFTHFEALSADEISRIERLVNAKIFENHPVRAYETSINVARNSGVTMLFGEKYDEFVRVLEVGNFSKELCGGTHVGKTTEIGFFKIVSESSVGASLRRIEAVTSFDAYDYTLLQQEELENIAKIFKAPTKGLVSRVEQLQAKIKELEQELKQASSAKSSGLIDELLGQLSQDAGYKLIVASPKGLVSKQLKPLWDDVRSRAVDALVVVSEDAESGQAIFLAAGNDAAVSQGFMAGELVKEIAALLGGRGGGKPSMAQGGALDASRIDEAIALVKERLG